MICRTVPAVGASPKPMTKILFCIKVLNYYSTQAVICVLPRQKMLECFRKQNRILSLDCITNRSN